jgi:hypothetical protein
MPKPHGTYLQVQKIKKIALRARQSKTILTLAAATTRRTFLKKLDLQAARNVAYLAHGIGTEPTDRGSIARRALSDLVDQLGEMKDKLDAMSELHTEMREPVFEFRAVTHGQLNISASNVLSIAMAVITLLMVIEKHTFGARKR